MGITSYRLNESMTQMVFIKKIQRYSNYDYKTMALQ